jgi:hypothetical protein
MRFWGAMVESVFPVPASDSLRHARDTTELCARAFCTFPRESRHSGGEGGHGENEAKPGQRNRSTTPFIRSDLPPDGSNLVVQGCTILLRIA